MTIKRGTPGADSLLGGAGNDVLLGLAGNDTLIGGTGNDRLDGGSGNDRLIGGGGDDVLIGGAGADRLRGDIGNDRYVLDSAAEIDKSIADAGVDTVEVSFTYALGTQQENLLLGASGAFNGTGNSGANSLTGNSAINRLNGGAGNDILIGGAGNDILTGGAGADLLRGDAGNDTYVIDGVNEINKNLRDAGFDTVLSSISYTLGAAQEALTLTGHAAIFARGNAGANLLIGNDGDNRLDGGSGADSLRGGAGNDTYVIDGTDEIDKNLSDAGFDTVLSSVSYTLGVAQEALTLLGHAALCATGNDDDNILIGNDGDNRLDGGAGLDQMFGGAGDDILVAELSGQFIDGGSGLDTLFIAGSGVAVRELLSDSHNVEVIDIRGSGANVLDLRTIDASIAGLALLSDNNGLRVRHDADDTVSIMIDFALNGARWQAGADRVIDGITYDHYTFASSGTTLDVESVAGILPLTSINGSNGFRLFEVGPGSPHSLGTAGDVNGDGYADFALGSRFADNHGAGSGSAFVAFGQAGGEPLRVVNTVDGSTGFRIDGTGEFDLFGAHVSAAGDVNGDGYGDVLFSASGHAVAGKATLIYGAAGGFAAIAVVDTLAANQASAFTIAALAQNDALQVGAAGDLNGDGLDDIVVGAHRVNINGERSGAAYVVFGSADGLPANVDLDSLDGNNGLRVVGTSYAGLGYSVGSAGDINGDGLADLLLGEYGDGPRGSAYVVFGSTAGFAAQLDLATLDGSNGLRLQGSFDSHDFGDSVSAAGDINGDGYDDIVVSDHVSQNAYVLFGSAQAFTASIDFSAFDGTRGLVITGGGVITVAGVGDINGDGYDDLLLGNAQASPHATRSGSSYVVYGSANGLGASLDLGTPDGVHVLRLDGEGTDTYSGFTVNAAGDVNGDGLADMLVGVNPLFLGYADSLGGYVVYGDTRSQDSALRGDSGDNILTGTSGGEALIGGAGNDVLNGAAAADVLFGGAGDDVLVWDGNDRRIAGGGGEDELRIDGAGVALDLTTLANNRLSGIERIALTGSGDNSLTLDIRDVLALPDHADQFLAHHTRQFLIDGDAGDVVHAAAQNWLQGANVELDGKTYASYTQVNIAAELLVDIAVTRDIS